MSIFAKLLSRIGRAGVSKAPAAVASGRAREVSKTIMRDDKRALLRPGDEQQLVFGGIAEGLIAFVTGEELLKGHSDKIQKLINGIGLPRDEFHRLIYPVIHAFADFAHNVPASKAHHHRSWGGLLEHSLDVACFALNSAVLTSFDYGSTPSQRTLRRERWYAAAAIAGLLHDSGKPLNDIKVHDEGHSNVWTGSLPIHEWAEQTGVERYFITWNPDRGESHKIISSTLFERFIPKATRDWLLEGGIDIYRAMADAIQGRDPKSLLTGIVIKSDSASVDLNLKTGAGLVAGGDAAVNVPNNFTNAAQYLLESGAWTVNARGARIWTTTAGVFVAWKSAVPEIVNFFDNHKIRGCPRGSDSLGSVLLDHGVFEPQEDGSLYWEVAPDALVAADSGKRLWLKCVKLSSSTTLYPFEAAPDPVAVCIGKEDNHTRYDPDAGNDAGQMVIDGAAVDPTEGSVSPMFSLDGSSDQKPVQPVAEVASKVEVSKAPEKAEAPSSKPTLGKAEAKSTITLGTGPVQKAGITLGITLESNAEPKPSALVIGGASNQVSKPEKQDKPTAQPQGSRKKKKKAGGGAAQPEAKALASKPAPKPVIESGPGIDDVFGTISGVNIDIPEAVAEAAPAPIAQLDDPFGAPGAADSADPFNFKPVAKPSAPKPVAQAERQAKLEQVGQLPVGLERAKPEQPAPALPVDESLYAGHLTDASAEAGGSAILDNDGLADFDADIMLMVGLKPVQGPATSMPRQPSIDVGLEEIRGPVAPPAPAVEGPISNSQYRQPSSIPAEFRFDLDESPVAADIPDLPDINPSQFKSAPEEVRVRDAAATQQALISLPPVEALVLATDEELNGFDAPSFVDGFVLPQEVEVAFEAPLLGESGCPEQLQTFDFDEPVVLDPSNAEVTSAPTLPTSPPRIERAPKPIPIAVATRHLDTDAITMSPASRGDLDWAAIGFNPAEPVTEPSLEIGKQVHPAAKKDRPSEQGNGRAEKSQIVNVVSQPEHGEESATPLSSKYSAEEAAVFEGFMARTSGVKEKLTWYLDPDQVKVVTSAMRPFLPFSKAGEGGITASDVKALSEAGWLWFNFINADDPYVSLNERRYGVFLSDAAADCIDYLSDGLVYRRTLSGYETSLSIDEMSTVASELIAQSKHHSIPPGGGARIFKFTNKMIMAFGSSRQLTTDEVKRSLFEHQDCLFTPTNFYVLVKDEVSIYE
ncbi:MobH family relaxase [Pseudomonas sp. GOM6]|uniref:MobH family relaxase n=1 Tax=Pseudomonas sp. GOM6 TaxID=3036944 RepID=UPI002409280B|nr:MobH family relaxase [Pseudomonas sp. GOM6]MDG1580847.1 MobH family relaxase [Pseudomonas sp. GOM6]